MARRQPQPPQQQVDDDPVVVGGPGQEGDPGTAGAAPEAPRLIEITISGKKYLVPEEAASAIDARERDFNAKLGEHSNELGTLRRRIQEFENPRRLNPDNNQPDNRNGGLSPDDEDLQFLERPSAHLKTRLDQLRKEVREELRQEYTEARRQEKWWEDFYVANPALDPKQDDFIVRSVIARHYQSLSTMSPEDAIGKAGELVTNEIMRIAGKQRSGAEPKPTGDRTVVEGGGNPRGAVAAGTEQKPPSWTVTGRLKKRREARRSAQS